jgi:glycosyltransferase involved in cell wall biosynthesis
MRRTVLPFVLRHATRVRVVSERIKQSLLRIDICESKIAVLPIRPELEVFVKASTANTKWEAFTVLTASRFAPEKNIPLLVRAFKRLHDRHTDTRLRIRGDGSELARIEHEVEACRLHDVVMILPWADDIATEMAKAHVFALASLHEAYGLVLIESLASGTPVVTTDVGCVGETVKHELHGLVVPTQDERAFGDALIRMHDDMKLRERAVHAGYTCTHTLLRESEEAYAKQWVALHSVEAGTVY